MTRSSSKHGVKIVNTLIAIACSIFEALDCAGPSSFYIHGFPLRRINVADMLDAVRITWREGRSCLGDMLGCFIVSLGFLRL